MHHAAQIHAHVAGNFFLGENVADRAGHPPQIFSARSDINIDCALNLIMIDFGRSQNLLHVDNILEHGGRAFAAHARPGSMARARLRRAGWAAVHSFAAAKIAQRNLSQVHHVVNGALAVLEVLHGEVVIVAAFAIDPIVGRDHIVGIQRGDDVIDYIFLRQPQFARVYAIHIEPQRGIVHILRNVDLPNAVQFAKSAG